MVPPMNQKVLMSTLGGELLERSTEGWTQPKIRSWEQSVWSGSAIDWAYLLQDGKGEEGNHVWVGENQKEYEERNGRSR